MRGKLSEPHFDVWLFSNPGEKVQKARKALGQICPMICLLFMTSSPRLETNDTLQCSSDSFPCMVKYILCVKNCQISTHSCLPIAGRLFQNGRKFHGPRISEYNLCLLGHLWKVWVFLLGYIATDTTHFHKH